MPRKARLDAPGTLHHVMVRGIEGLPLFRDPQDRLAFLSRIKALVPKTGTKVLAWALMDNHVHFLLISGPAGISKLMRCLLTGYALGYNRRYRRRGHLFQNRYKSIVCEEEPYLLQLVRYIHLNPLRAGMVASLTELDHFPWSGHGVLLGCIRQDWQDQDYVLRYFSPDRKRAARAYRAFMEAGEHQGRREELVGGGLIRSLGGWSQVLSMRGKEEPAAYDARILGGDEFVKKTLEEADPRVRRQLKPLKKKESIDTIIRESCEKKGVDERELRNGGQRTNVSRLRAEVAFRLSRELGVPLAEIARNLGVCSTAILKAIQKREGGK